MFDAAIIGSGPAGISAALNMKLHNKNFVWFGSADLSAKVEKSEKIANYPGFGMITGTALNQSFSAQMAQMEIAPADRMVTAVMASEDGYSLLAENDIYEARTLLLAPGAAAAKGFPGETDFLGRGVSYCATCDGFLYRGKTIAVFCGDRRYEHEALYLAELAEKLYLHVPYADCGIDRENVEILQKPIARVRGEGRIAAIVLSDGTEKCVDGLFCLRSAVSPTVLLPDLAMDGAHIVVNRQMETNLPGCFAAGDCTGRPYQIAKAVGEGNVAAHSMLEYLFHHTGKLTELPA